MGFFTGLLELKHIQIVYFISLKHSKVWKIPSSIEFHANEFQELNSKQVLVINGSDLISIPVHFLSTLTT